jgi:hypothetical protein
MLQPRKTRALNPHRKFSRAQIKAGFGGKRRQSSLKAKRHVSAHKHRAASGKNPKRRAPSPKAKRRVAHKHRNTQPRVIYRTRKVYVEKPKRRVKANRSKSKRRKSNPGPYLMTLAPVLGSNPHKKRRKKTMAKPKRRVSAKRSGKRNPTRRRSAKRRTSNHRRRSSNPFGQSTTTILKTGVGVIIGVSAAKLLPRNYPATWTGSAMMSIFSTGVTAAALAWLAARFIKGPIADGVLWGGAAQTINVAVNAFAPASVAQYGLGDFVAGGFPLPQGPVRYALQAAPMLAPNGSQVNVGAFGRAW